MESKATFNDALSSSYLNGVKLGKPSCRGFNSVVSDRMEDGEIDVFAAERYFNGMLDDGETLKPSKIDVSKHRAEEDEECPLKPKTCPETPCLRSESSRSSRTAPLLEIPRDLPTRRECTDTSLFWRIDCDNRDVHDETISQKSTKEGNVIGFSSIWEEGKRIQPVKLNRLEIGTSADDRLSFLVLDSEKGNRAAKMQLLINYDDVDVDDDDGRKKSLEVFGSPIAGKGERHSGDHRRRLDFQVWDAFPHSSEEAAVPANFKGLTMNDDTESDASSDLFEIESFSSSGYPLQTTKECGGNTPSSRYAPSEASIEWSVVTASQADYSVATSDTEEKCGGRDSKKSAVSGAKPAGKDKSSKGHGIFRGCKNRKAVRVVGDAYISNQKAIRQEYQGIGSFRKASRSDAGNKLVAIDFWKGERDLATHKHHQRYPSEGLSPSSLMKHFYN